MNKKFIWIFAVILIIITGGVFYFWYRQQLPQVNIQNNMTYPQASNFDFYLIHEIKQNRFTSGDYNTEGYVVKIYTCPLCPKGAQCKVCMRDNIVISENNRLIDPLKAYLLTDHEIVLFADSPNQFELGKKYQFSIEILDSESAEIIGYGTASNDANMVRQNIVTSSIVGKWEVVSVEENGVVIVPQGNGATIEFLENGTYQALGGCNEMAIRTYETGLDFKLSIKAGGTKKKCGKDVVEFWDLNGGYAYKFANNTLFLYYKTQNGMESSFKLQKVNPDPSINPTSGWKTYTDTKDNYSFKYPGDWNLLIGQSLPIVVNIIHFIDKTESQKWVIEIRFIPKDRLSFVGVTYCGAYSEDSKRCENILVDNVNGMIDWGPGTNDEYTATGEISYINKGIISLTLTPINPETKKILYQILSTFKFLN